MICLPFANCLNFHHNVAALTFPIPYRSFRRLAFTETANGAVTTSACIEFLGKAS